MKYTYTAFYRYSTFREIEFKSIPELQSDSIFSSCTIQGASEPNYFQAPKQIMRGLRALNFHNQLTNQAYLTIISNTQQR